MKTIKRYVCEKCSKPIDPGCGVVLDSDMCLVAETEEHEPIISNTVAGVDSKPTAYHIGCLIKSLTDVAVKDAKKSLTNVAANPQQDLWSQDLWNHFFNTAVGLGNIKR